jgi:hypothetical protein
MHATRNYLGVTSLGLAALLTLGCDNSTAPVTPGAGEIVIAVSTIGSTSNVDPDGYTLSIDWERAQTVSINSLVKIGSLQWGRHSIQLEGLASNCSLTDTSPRYIDVLPNKLLPAVSFVVSCGAEEGGWWDY